MQRRCCGCRYFLLFRSSLQGTHNIRARPLSTDPKSANTRLNGKAAGEQLPVCFANRQSRICKLYQIVTAAQRSALGCIVCCAGGCAGLSAFRLYSCSCGSALSERIVRLRSTRFQQRKHALSSEKGAACCSRWLST